MLQGPILRIKLKEANVKTNVSVCCCGILWSHFVILPLRSKEEEIVLNILDLLPAAEPTKITTVIYTESQGEDCAAHIFKSIPASLLASTLLSFYMFCGCCFKDLLQIILPPKISTFFSRTVSTKCQCWRVIFGGSQRRPCGVILTVTTDLLLNWGCSQCHDPKEIVFHPAAKHNQQHIFSITVKWTKNIATTLH